MQYYNEFEPKTAAWLRELVGRGHLPAGVVDERSIEDVPPGELCGYEQCHFFAGIGGWAITSRLAGVPDDFPLWSGSCPCQPFSDAGLRRGTEDSRHLWPAFRWLIAQHRPPIVVGEQVASADGREWLAGIRLDLEAMGYRFGAADLCAAGVGAPHIRQRLFWIAYTPGERCREAWGRLNRSAQRVGEQCDVGGSTEPNSRRRQTGESGLREGQSFDGLAESVGGASDTNNTERRPNQSRGDKQHGKKTKWNKGNGNTGECFAIGGEPDTLGDGLQGQQPGRPAPWPVDGERFAGGVCNTEDTNRRRGKCGTEKGTWENPERRRRLGISGPWSEYRLHRYLDGKARRIPVEPTFFPLAHGLPARVVRLRGYGNAIVPQLAALFLQEALAAIAKIEGWKG